MRSTRKTRRTFDVTAPAAIKPLGLFEVSELDSPFARNGGMRFGAHQFHEAMTGTLIHAVWFGGGLRIIDVADPAAPREVGFFIPEPAGEHAAPQSNDVMLDERGLIYMAISGSCGMCAGAQRARVAWIILEPRVGPAGRR